MWTKTYGKDSMWRPGWCVSSPTVFRAGSVWKGSIRRGCCSSFSPTFEATPKPKIVDENRIQHEATKNEVI